MYFNIYFVNFFNSRLLYLDDLCYGVTCSNPGETCVVINNVGVCKCGSGETCVGSTTAPFCDSANNVCKCSAIYSACSNPGETCNDGLCKCGTAGTCILSPNAPYCDAANNVCKCTASVSACNPGETCSDGICNCDVSSLYQENMAVGRGRGNGVGKVQNVQTVEDCHAECAKVPACNFFIWNGPNCRWQRFSCWLKRNNNNPKRARGRISGPVSC